MPGIGTVLQNRYRVVSLLGQGGMGAVYRAWDLRLNIPVALKEMTPQVGLDPQLLAQLRQQFQQEAATLANLSHPSLVRVSDYFTEGANSYLVMDLVEGQSLAALIEQRGALPEEQVLTWAQQLLSALAYCHERNIIHRDIKPLNVIIRPDGQAVLVDFGLLKLWDPHSPHTRTVVRGMGTPEYAPPEQYGAHTGHTDSRSDLYSLGATLYHALTGYAPQPATDRLAQPARFQPPRQLNAQLGATAEAAVLRAMELPLDARFQSASEMSTALSGQSPAAVRQKQPAAPRFPTAVVVAAGLLLLVCLVAGIAAGATWLSNRASPVTVAEQSPAPPGTHSVPVAADTTAPLPTLAPTLEPSPTSPPSPTSLPTTTPIPTATPAPTCPPVSGPFASTWSARRDQLGCALNDAHSPTMAEERFERGIMFWREDVDTISVLYTNGRWALYQDIWYEGNAEYSCPAIAPSTSPPTPRRGFGKIWCTYNQVRDGLGAATAGERGFYGSTVQDFERGTIMRTDSGATYVLYDDGSWE